MSSHKENKKNAPVIVIGLDGAEATLIEQYLAEGKLPVLRQLQQEGCWRRLSRDRDMFSDTIWIDFLTGVSSSYHGMVSWAQIKPGTYQIENTNATTFFRYKKPFYAQLKDPEKRVVVVDVPKTRPFEGVNGAQICAWGAHSHQYHPSSSPEELYHDVESRFGKSTLRDNDEDDRFDDEYFQGLLDWLRETPDQRANICCYLYEKYQPDFLLTVFSETHSVGHRFWHFMDESHPHHHPEAPAKFKNAIPDIYQACDQAIGKILETVPENSTILIFSLHGMGQNSHDVSSLYLLPEFLYRFSFPDIPRNTQEKRGGMLQTLRELVPTRVRNSFKHLVPLPIRAFIYRSRIERFMYKEHWPTMKAFALHSASTGYIRFNLQGREPQGIIPPEQYDQLCDELTAHLMELVEPRTGKPAVTKVHKRRDAHKGPLAEEVMPDLFVEWADLSIEAVHSPRFGDIGPVRMERTGTHRPRGIFFLKGTGLPSSGEQLEDTHVSNLTPTLLSLMEEPIPEKMQGKKFLH